MGIAIQIVGAGVVSFLSMIMGILFSWPSSTLDNFKSNQTVLSHVMSPTEVSLFGSVASIGALIGTLIFGYLLDKIGRKYCSIIGGLPFLLGWVMIASSNRVEVILAALFIAGIGGGSSITSPVFVSEICQDSIRGRMTSCTVLLCNTGVLLSYAMGGYLPYNVMVYSHLTLVALYLLFMSFLKDSPLYLMQKGREEEAAKSIAFYRSVKPDSKEVLEELCNLRRILKLDSAVPSPEEEKLKPGTTEPSPKEILSPLKFLLKTPSARRALLVCLTLVTSSVLMGLVVVQVYAEPLFGEAVPNMSPNVCSLIFAVVTIVANLIASCFTDRAGRKMLMLVSSGASAICTLLLATQLQLQWGPHVLTAVLIYIFCFVYSIGAGTIPYVVVAEVFLPEIRSFCSMLVLEWAWLCNFFILLVFNPLVDSLGLGPVFYIFCIICFATSVFCFFFQPETKGLPVDVIQTLFVKKRRFTDRT